MAGKHRVLILGGGFGGLVAAQTLKRANAQITLIDKRNFHLFQPLRLRNAWFCVMAASSPTTPL